LKITIKYFSWIRVKKKKIFEKINVPNETNFDEFKNILKKKEPIFLEIFKDKSIKFFLNLNEINDHSIILNDGDEIAFLPPVTGG
tara:strand:+ start:628 stop:882 length:255 start_codon:yes stop_codon:yes gene_type:complete